jgi:transcription elongation factor Elf1
MKALSVSCQNCGAPLEVAEGVRFITCGFCNSRLEIHRSPTSVYSELIDKIERRTEEMAENLGVIRIQNELEQLDREWMMQRDGFMVRGKDGSTSEPGGVGGLVASLFAAGFGVVWTIFAASMGAPWPFPLFGVIFICFALFGGISTMAKGSRYQSARDEYEERRRILLERINSRPLKTAQHIHYK